MHIHDDRGHVLITGGAGFIGANLADRLLADGRRVVVFDNLSRAGVELNARWLAERWGDHVTIVRGDTRDREALRAVMPGATEVFHFAAQVAVTTSIDDPLTDFAINGLGTLHVLEEARRCPTPPAVFFTSTNKVYGSLPDVAMTAGSESYAPVDQRLRAAGIDESRQLDFHSPYGCSKGLADQYLLDYARTYGLRTVVLRMSCIYGPRQFGTEDQGWVAHFLISALNGLPLTLYGDGRQVRDVLFVDDLVDAFLLAGGAIDRTAGRAYNVGGGPANAVSLLGMVEHIEALTGATLAIDWSQWRLGDQRWYVSDTSRLRADTGWRPRTAWRDGVARLHRWLVEGEDARETVRDAV
ncbi:MAG TPA: SDR family NAD(P)-dependent oxidoreductase [Planctomycetota bacterium]|nr:SDR family NAD(P)-dependent oxidoreductase [Planctomycetota bacterium]